MYTIQGNIAVTGTHWGLEFKAGVAQTENAALAQKLKAKGYVVTDGEAEEIPKEPDVQPVRAKGKKAVKDRVLNID